MSWSAEIGTHEYVAIAFHCRHCDINETVDNESDGAAAVAAHIVEHDIAWRRWMVLDLRELSPERALRLARMADRVDRLRGVPVR